MDLRVEFGQWLGLEASQLACRRAIGFFEFGVTLEGAFELLVGGKGFL